ncbi:MAG TPA: hypothetical protein VI756_01645 [Blastocatellia bacterium]
MMQTTAESGKVQREYRLFTNDPSQLTITLTMACTVKPVPDWMGRLQNPNLLFGSRVGNFTVWPTAEPQLRIAKGETFKLALRVAPAGPDSAGPAEPAVTAPASPAFQSGNGEYNAANQTPRPLPADKIDYQAVDMTEGEATGGFWLTIDIGPIDEPGVFSYKLTIPDRHGKPVDVSIALSILVIDDQFVVSPASVDLGEIKISAMTGDEAEVARFGLRRVLRPFEIKELQCSLPFLKVSTQPIVNGRNYFIKLGTVPGSRLRPKSYDGTVRIVTDDKVQPVIEVPIKLKLIR